MWLWVKSLRHFLRWTPDKGTETPLIACSPTHLQEGAWAQMFGFDVPSKMAFILESFVADHKILQPFIFHDCHCKSLNVLAQRSGPIYSAFMFLFHTWYMSVGWPIRAHLEILKWLMSKSGYLQHQPTEIDKNRMVGLLLTLKKTNVPQQPQHPEFWHTESLEQFHLSRELRELPGHPDGGGSFHRWAA